MRFAALEDLKAAGKTYDIMHIIGATVAGGAENFVSDLSIRQHEGGRRVAVAALSNRFDAVGKNRREQLKKAGVALLIGPCTKVGLPAVLWLKRLINQTQPGIVHLHTPNTELALALALLVGAKKRKIARTIHSVKIASSTLYRWAYNSNGVPLSIACGQAVQGLSIIKNTKIIVINNGVAFDWPIQTQLLKHSCRERLGLSTSKRHFVAVGSMKGERLENSPKGHDILIKAWRESSLAKDAELHLLGDGNLRPQLEQLAIGMASVRFHGITSDVKSWLTAADTFVMPSRYEGLPIGGIEAVGTGIRCIFSDIDSLAGLRQINTLVFHSDDVMGLARMLERAHSEDMEVTIEEVEVFREKFGVTQAEKKYDAYYEKLQGM